MEKSDSALRNFVDAIIEGDDGVALQLLHAQPTLAQARFQEGAGRQAEMPFFLASIGRYIWAGDTALHLAAAAYQTKIVRELLRAGADVRSRNRLGDEPLHAAAVGQPGSEWWNPAAQAATIVCLIHAGADPNTLNKTGVSPLHRAVRSRCAKAVETLLDHGADPALRNKSGSTAKLLATYNTGRGGSGSPEAKEEQKEILRLLETRTKK